MKTIFGLLCVLVSASVFSLDGKLDGKKFCRSVHVGGFGRPPGIGKHCLTFKKGVATDNRNTLFGNPPESYIYDVNKNKIVNVDENKNTGYVLKNKTTIMNKDGAVLKKVSSVKKH